MSSTERPVPVIAGAGEGLPRGLPAHLPERF
jgi:hypothetical protein